MAVGGGGWWVGRRAHLSRHKIELRLLPACLLPTFAKITGHAEGTQATWSLAQWGAGRGHAQRHAHAHQWRHTHKAAAQSHPIFPSTQAPPHRVSSITSWAILGRMMGSTLWALASSWIASTSTTCE